MSHKETAVSFLTLVTSGKIREAYEQYIASGFKHHNPFFKGDIDSLMNGMEENDKQYPNKIYRIKHITENEDIVMVHGHVVLKEKELEIAVVHIFRFEDDKIAELWDIGQQIPKDSPNENGMF